MQSSNCKKKCGFDLTTPSGATIDLKAIQASIKIFKCGSSRVSIGIDAPEHIKISRSKNVKNEL